MMTHDEKMLAAANLGEKVRAFVNSIETPPKPDLPEKVGFKWVLDYTFGSNSFAWKSVPDPDAKGTRENPFEWVASMATMVNAWYTHGDKLYVCVQAGNPSDITDTAYFEEM